MAEKFRTIVGGRSRSNRLAGDSPRGIEILLKKASVDPAFRLSLLQEPLAAARSILLDLKQVEIDILESAPRPILERMIENTFVPKQHVKTFRTAPSAAILALLLSTTVVVPVLAGGGQEELPAQTIEQEEITRNRMALVQEALEAYKNDHGFYPSTREWFENSAILSEYVPQSELYDPWKRKFHYNAVKEKGEIVSYKLESYGLNLELYDDNIPCPVITHKHQFTGINPIIILFPSNGSLIDLIVDPDGLNITRREARAEHTDAEAVIHWYLNGVNIGSTVKVHYLTIEPAQGRNTLLLIDENEVSADTIFYARKMEPAQ